MGRFMARVSASKSCAFIIYMESHLYILYPAATGEFLHRNTFKVLFRGTVGNQSELEQGILYDKDGSILGKYNNSKFLSDPYAVFKKLR